jgi:hypothetical protein
LTNLPFLYENHEKSAFLLEKFRKVGMKKLIYPEKHALPQVHQCGKPIEKRKITFLQ